MSAALKLERAQQRRWLISFGCYLLSIPVLFRWKKSQWFMEFYLKSQVKKKEEEKIFKRFFEEPKVANSGRQSDLMLLKTGLWQEVGGFSMMRWIKCQPVRVIDSVKVAHPATRVFSEVCLNASCRAQLMHNASRWVWKQVWVYLCVRLHRTLCAEEL